MFNTLIRSGDIRDQSQTLPNIAPIFGRFFLPSPFFGRVFQKLYQRYHPYLVARRLNQLS